MTMQGDPYGRAGSFTDKSDPTNEKALEFIESMTMPVKIWAGQYPNNQSAGDWDVVKEFDGDILYVRADIAEELARALDAALADHLSFMTRKQVDAALSRYRAIAN